MDWAIKMPRIRPGLTGVMQEMVSSKGFGMDDKQTRAFIGMLQDQGAYRGWDLTAAQGPHFNSNRCTPASKSPRRTPIC